jgi:hypothetical protein
LNLFGLQVLNQDTRVGGQLADNSKQPRTQQVLQESAAIPPKENKAALSKLVRVLIFWAGDIEEANILRYVDNGIPQASLNFKAILDNAMKQGVSVQRELFAPNWLKNWVIPSIPDDLSIANNFVRYTRP